MPDAPPVHKKSLNKGVLEESNIFSLASPQVLQPIPTAILTSIPYNMKLETSVKEKNMKANKSKER